MHKNIVQFIAAAGMVCALNGCSDSSTTSLSETPPLPEIGSETVDIKANTITTLLGTHTKYDGGLARGAYRVLDCSYGTILMVPSGSVAVAKGYAASAIDLVPLSPANDTRANTARSTCEKAGLKPGF